MAIGASMRLKKIKKYIEKRVYLALQHAFYSLIVVQPQNNDEIPC